jgi:SpoIID/LytB domain protein
MNNVKKIFGFSFIILCTFLTSCATIKKVSSTIVKQFSSVQWLVPAEGAAAVKKEVKYKKVPGYRVQIAASASKDGAEGLAKSVEDLIPGVRPHVVEDGGMYKVRMGDFTDKQEAVKVQQQLQKAGFADCWVTADTVEVPIAEEEGEFIDPTKYRVQVASCRLKESAENIKSTLQSAGIKDKIYIVSDAGMYKVRVGDCNTKDEAENLRQTIVKLGYSDAWIVAPTQTAATGVSARPSPTGLSFPKELLDNIKIGIVRNQPQVVVYSNGDFEFRDKDKKLICEGKAWDMWILKISGAGEVGKTIYYAAPASYTDEATANATAELLRQTLGLPVIVLNEPPWYKVRVGEATTREEAQKIVDKLKAMGYDQTWIDKRTIQPKTKGKIQLIDPDENVKGEYEDPIYFVPKSTSSYIGVAGKLYRGRLIARIGLDGLLTIINELNIDDYIKGVVPKEIGADKHDEALKAQAVAARTETLSKLGRHSDEGFDLCATVCCQVYGGMSAETPRTNKAVEDTIGEVITIRDRLASTVYHACCGGYTEDASAVWGSGSEYLVAVPCFEQGQNTEFQFPLNKEENFVKWVKGKPRAFCEDYTKFFRWEKRFTETQLAATLAQKGYNVGKVLDIKLGERGPAGTLKSITIIGTEGQQTINSEYKIREALGGVMNFYSGRFIVEIEKDPNTQEKIWKFIGAGWGHGVGMCQYGAATAAAKYGWDYKKILQHYFPGTVVKKVY